MRITRRQQYAPGECAHRQLFTRRKTEVQQSLLSDTRVRGSRKEKPRELVSLARVGGHREIGRLITREDEE